MYVKDEDRPPQFPWPPFLRLILAALLSKHDLSFFNLVFYHGPALRFIWVSFTILCEFGGSQGTGGCFYRLNKRNFVTRGSPKLLEASCRRQDPSFHRAYSAVISCIGLLKAISFPNVPLFISLPPFMKIVSHTQTVFFYFFLREKLFNLIDDEYIFC